MGTLVLCCLPVARRNLAARRDLQTKAVFQPLDVKWNIKCKSSGNNNNVHTLAHNWLERGGGVIHRYIHTYLPPLFRRNIPKKWCTAGVSNYEYISWVGKAKKKSVPTLLNIGVLVTALYFASQKRYVLEKYNKTARLTYTAKLMVNVHHDRIYYKRNATM